MRLFLIIATLLQCGCTSYVFNAYFKRTNTAIRGYPTVEPPKDFTGVWTHYKWNGKKLAEIPFWRGKTHGTAFYYKDDGAPYLIRRYEYGHFAEDYLIEPVPKTKPIIPFWFPGVYKFSSVPPATISSESE